MPPPNEKQLEIILDYLREDRGVRVQVGEKIDHLSRLLQTAMTDLQLTNQKMEQQTELLQSQIKGLSARVDRLEERDEITDRHNIEDLKLQVKAKEEEKQKIANEKDERFWRTIRMIIYFVLTIVGSGSGGAFIHHLMESGFFGH